jgi:hypothetical protein
MSNMPDARNMNNTVSVCFKDQPVEAVCVEKVTVCFVNYVKCVNSLRFLSVTASGTNSMSLGF